MKNQLAKFTCAADATLTISLRERKEGFKLAVRQHTPGERAQEGCKDYFDAGQDTEAQAAFDRRVKEAVAAGWLLKRKAERAPAFTSIPQAPKATTPKAVAAGRR